MLLSARAAPPMVSVQYGHTLALGADGKVVAWGGDALGQLGVGRTLYSTSPTRIAGLPALSQMSAGATHVLALDVGGQVWAWGDNVWGNLGPRDQPVASVPARVKGLTDVVAVSAGSNFSVAVRRDGSVYTWGLDLAAYQPSPTPAQVPGATGITQVAAGANHVLALRGDGQVFAMGYNTYGELGDTTPTGRVHFAPVAGLGKVRQVSAAGATSVALTEGGQVWTWGLVPGGQSATPVRIEGFAGPVRHVAAGYAAYAVLADGSLWTWQDERTARRVEGIANIQTASSTLSYAGVTLFALATDGRLFTRGNNSEGLLGIGNTTRNDAVQQVPGHLFTQVAGINANEGGYVLALKADGSLYYWGANLTGVSGEATLLSRSVPVREVAGLSDITEISAGANTSFALTRDGKVYGWGDGTQGQMGDGARVRRSRAALIEGLPSITRVAAGAAHALFLDTAGKVWQTGVLGDFFTAVPAQLPGLTDIVAIASGCYSALALDRAGTVYEWGAYYEYASGEPRYMRRDKPTAVPITDPVAQISASCSHNLALTRTQRLWSWGNNSQGALGDGTFISRSTPRPIAGVANFTQISAGNEFSLALQSDGRVVSWGYSESLGNGSLESSAVPVLVKNFGNVRHIAAGGQTAYAIATDGVVYAWGRSQASAFRETLGDGTYATRLTAVPVRQIDGGGNLDAAGSNWALDLDAAVANTVAAEFAPGVLTVSQVFGSDSNATLTTQVSYRDSDRGRTVNNYVLGLVPRDFLDQVASAAQSAPVDKRAKRGNAIADGDLVLVQLTPTGWQVVTGQLTALTTNVAGASGTASNILNNINLRTLTGGQFCVGYGSDATAMIQQQSIAAVLSLRGAQSSSGGLPCLRSGVYLEGPTESRVGSSASFNATVIGASPGGRITLNDRDTVLAETTLSASASPAVAGTYFLLDNLAPGTRVLRAAYAGDAQNPPATSDALLHERLQPTYVTASVPVSAVNGSSVPVNIQVTGGTAPITGTVKVRVDDVQVASASLVAGALSTSVPAGAVGAHTLKVEYIGDSPGYAPAQSAAVAYTVGGVSGALLPFASRRGAAINTLVTSEARTVNGLASPAAVSISGGEYSVGCLAEFTDQPGVLVEGQSVCLRVLSASAAGETRTATLTIGTVASTFSVTTAADSPPSYHDIWWTPGESGHGVAMIQHGRNIFLAWYLYDGTGKADWVVLPSGSWNASLTEYTGALYRPSGANFAQYDASRFNANPPVGSATLRFTGSDAAVLNYAVNGVSGSKNIARFAFGTAGSTAPVHVGDLWWGGASNNGWGISIAQQFGMLFIAWYTYDAAGRPQWFVAPAGTWLGKEWTGDVYRVTGAPVLGVAYDASRVQSRKVGTLSLSLYDSNRALLRYDVDGQRGSYPLTRLGF
jgi:alpha-tubulin suppressor-like RCC1 family protein